MIAEPPLFTGAIKATETCPSPAVAVPIVGASATVGIATVWDEPLVNAAGPILPAPSAILVDALRFTLIVPLPTIPLTVTVKLEPDPETLAIVPLAVPVIPNAKSSVETPVTDSLKVTVKFTLVAAAVGLPLTTMLDTEGATPSITKALLLPNELAAPGEARVKVASLPAASLIVPPPNASELVAT